MRIKYLRRSMRSESSIIPDQDLYTLDETVTCKIYRKQQGN